MSYDGDSTLFKHDKSDEDKSHTDSKPKEKDDPIEKRKLLQKLAKICGTTYFSNITTVEADLEEYLKELLDGSITHSVTVRDDGIRAGEEVTVYDGKAKTMFHTGYSRFSRNELKSMLKTCQKLDPKGKYRSMRVLPLSIEDIKI
jgi:hypothetical protein